MAGLFQAASKQRNPLGTTIRTHGSGKYTFGLALSAGQYPRSACLSYQLLAVCGIFLTNVINYIIASYGSRSWDVNAGWRWMLRWVRFRPPRSCSPWCEHRKAHDSSFKPAKPKRDSRCSSTSSAPNRHAFALTTSMHRSNSKPKCRMNFTTCSAQGCRRRSSSAL